MSIATEPRPSAPMTAGTPSGTGSDTPSPPTGRPSGGNAKRAVHRWARRLHVYTSMVALLIVLFFGLTGITLNHPDWTFGDGVTTTDHTGSFPFETTADDGAIDFLAIAEYVRSEYDVKGTVDSYAATDGEGFIVFKNPGYSADLAFDTDTDSFDLVVTEQGFVAVMNDLHKGRDAGPLWKLVIDISAGFLVAISLTGLTMQFFLRKRRRPALVTAVVGGLATAVLVLITLA